MNPFSYWEKREIKSPSELLIVGSGIVGLCSALSYRELYPRARIRIVERGLFPNGASTKNAGFACLGCPTELIADLRSRPRAEVIETLAMRFKGLQRLFSWVDKDLIRYENCGGFELFTENDQESWTEVKERIAELNDLYYTATNAQNALELEPINHSFKGVIGTAQLRLEGALNPWSMVQGLLRKTTALHIDVWNGVEVKNLSDNESGVEVETNIGTLRTDRLLLCTNGLTNALIKGLDLRPARAQVLVARTDKPIGFKGTYHMNEGYYYFRHLDDRRVLLGGGRQLDILGETTTDMNTTKLIQSNLEDLLKAVILPEANFEIENRWAGIMAIGEGKRPLIGRASGRVRYAVRMGGMGVAIGAEVAHRAARLWL